MQSFSILIDRVGNINIFNLIEGHSLSQNTHLQSIVDDDLIVEFLSELDRCSRIANSIFEYPNQPFINLKNKIQNIGEVFFSQFFPKEIQKKIQSLQEACLLWNVSCNLRNIPWELLHDGTSFLAERFYMARNIEGFRERDNNQRKDKLKMLIIADPTEDLEWARQEGEYLFETLHSKVSTAFLDIKLISGSRINKIELLQLVKKSDIIHYAGHTFHHDQSEESGWLLSGGKVLHAREIKRTGAIPLLVFSNSCIKFSSEKVTSLEKSKRISSKNENFYDLPGAFLSIGVCSYIGTNWDIQDNKSTCHFALEFYRSIFEENSVSVALFDARKFVQRNSSQNDLTWANYSLYGDTLTQIFYSPQKKKSFDASRIQAFLERSHAPYPISIIQSYQNFLRISQKKSSSNKAFSLLCEAFQITMKTIASLMFADFYHSCTDKKSLQLASPLSLRAIISNIYECSSFLHSLHTSMIPSRLTKSLKNHQNTIETLLNWDESFQKGQIQGKNLKIHLISFQYHLDNLLNDLTALGHCQIIYLHKSGKSVFLLNSEYCQELPVTSLGFHRPENLKVLMKHQGKTCILEKQRRRLLSLEPYMKFQMDQQKISFPVFKTN